MSKTFLFSIDGIDTTKYNKDNNFLTSKEYEALTRTIICRYVKNKYVKNFILANPDLFNEIQHKIMMGDWRFTEGKGKTPETYRIQCGIWAINKLYEKMKSPSKTVSIDGPNTMNEKAASWANQMEDHRAQNPFLKEEEIEQILTEIKVTDKQRNCIEGLIEGKNINQIAQDMGVTNKAVYIHIKHIKQKIKKLSKNGV